LSESPSADEQSVIDEAIVSCATAEGLLRGMLVRLDFSASDLLDRHLGELDDVLETVSNQGISHPSLGHLTAARDALHASYSAFDPWRFSTDPEHSHMPFFQRESLRLLDIARSECDSAVAALT
jgi:hypothetical protein